MQKPPNKLNGRLRIAFENDDETPVMVYMNRESASATYFCALEEGVDGFDLTEKELIWLHSFEQQAEAWFNFKREETSKPAH